VGALASHVKATAQTRMLIRINQPHAFHNPEHYVVKNFAQVTDGTNVLDLIELLKSSLLLAGHLGRCDVEYREAYLFDLPVNAVDSRTPAEDN